MASKQYTINPRLPWIDEHHDGDYVFKRGEGTEVAVADRARVLQFERDGVPVVVDMADSDDEGDEGTAEEK